MPQVTAHALPIGITIPLVEETTAPRTGYMKIDVGGATVDLSGLSENDVHVCSSCGFLSSICSAITDSGFVKGLVISRSRAPSRARSEPLADQLCMAPSPALNPPCPTDTAPDACEQALRLQLRQEQVRGMLLGTDAHADLGGLLKSISPGTAGGVDFGLAAGGSMMPFPTPTRTRRPHAERHHARHARRRHPAAAVEVRPGGRPQDPDRHPIPDELAPTAADGPTAPHVGIALAGRFLDYSFGSVYNSGLLCLGVSSEQIDQLRSGLLSILIPSLKTLTFEQADAPAAIATRPQAPPTVKIGGARTRAPTRSSRSRCRSSRSTSTSGTSTATSVSSRSGGPAHPGEPPDRQGPKTNPNGGIIPAIGDIKVSNGSVTNADLLMDDPALVSGALSGLLGGLSKQLVGGGFSPIDLSGALKSFGLGMEIGKIGKLTKGTDDYVGIFANLSKAAAPRPSRLIRKRSSCRRTSRSTTCSSRPWTRAFCRSSWSTSARRSRTVATPSSTRGGSTTAPAPSGRRQARRHQGRPAAPPGSAHPPRVRSRRRRGRDEDATPAEIPFTIDALAPS